MSVCSDNENFISADSHRINMWNFDKKDVIYRLIESDEEADIITHCEYHKTNPNLFIYSTTSGYFDYCDLRVSTTVKSAAIRF